MIARTQGTNLLDAFQYELCSYPPALFETKHVLLKAKKLALAKVTWDLFPQGDRLDKPSNCQYVFDGGVQPHRIPWQIGDTCKSILQSYTSHVKKRYGKAVILFDGYTSGPSTKDGTHQRRLGTLQGRAVNFQTQMSLKIKTEEFLSSDENNQRFINFLSDSLEAAGCEVHHPKDDADLLIVQTAIKVVLQRNVILARDDTDLLVLLCYLTTNVKYNLFWRPEPKKGKKERLLNIGRV